LKGFILDENVPKRITFTPQLPVISASMLGHSLSDSSIWELAYSKRYGIITKDADFTARIVLTSPPPWIIHLRIGNMRKREFHAFLQQIWPRIEQLLPEHKLINVYRDRIEAIR
jgi:predicted nuclease of predicted toxin-antitoxin system